MTQKGLPFTYPGTVAVGDCKTAAEVMTKAHLNWEVGKCEVYAKMSINNSFDTNYMMVPNAYATYRKDNGQPLGVVKERYTPVQNIDAFNFFDNAIGKDKAIWYTAGSLGAGQRVFVAAKLPDTILIDGDPVDNYLVIMNSHDGSTGLKIMLTPVRIFCTNCLNAAIRSADKYISFRHTKSVHSNLDLANDILGISKAKIIALKEVWEELAKKPMSDDKAADTFARLILTESEIDNLLATGHNVKQIINRDFNAMQDANISTKKVNIITDMNNYYHNGIAQDEIRGTAWGVYNAVTGYYSNVDNVSGQKRFDSLLYGDKANKIEKVGNYLLTV